MKRTTLTSQSSIPPVRSGFTLIELMVVMIIIALLAAMLFPAIRGAQSAARKASVVADIKGLEKALADFKLKYGVLPPSSIILYEQATGNPSWSQHTAGPAVPGETPAMSGAERTALREARRMESIAFIRQVWPNFDFGFMGDPPMTAATTAGGPPDNPVGGNRARDINGDGDEIDVIVLSGAECLAFFLGGVFATDVVDQNGRLQSGATAGTVPTKWSPLGFSANPTYPFARGGSRVGPFVEILSDRLVNYDRSTTPDDAMPELLDTFPAQSVPYTYASSYDGRGYRDADLAAGLSSLTQHYKDGTGTSLNSKSYQIISPGLDAEFGLGGVIDGKLPGDRANERDNITNFKGGSLE